MLTFIGIIVLKLVLKNFITDYLLVKFLKVYGFEILFAALLSTYVKLASN